MSESVQDIEEALSDTDDKAPSGLGVRIARFFHFLVESGVSESDADAQAVEIEGDIELGNSKPN